MSSFLGKSNVNVLLYWNGPDYRNGLPEWTTGMDMYMCPEVPFS